MWEIAMDVEKIFGEVLKQNRNAQSLSQEELAHLSDLDRTYISMLERGKRQPSLKTIFLLASTLNILPSEIMIKVESLIVSRKLIFRISSSLSTRAFIVSPLK